MILLSHRVAVCYTNSISIQHMALINIDILNEIQNLGTTELETPIFCLTLKNSILRQSNKSLTNYSQSFFNHFKSSKNNLKMQIKEVTKSNINKFENTKYKNIYKIGGLYI